MSVPQERNSSEVSGARTRGRMKLDHGQSFSWQKSQQSWGFVGALLCRKPPLLTRHLSCSKLPSRTSHLSVSASTEGWAKPPRLCLQGCLCPASAQVTDTCSSTAVIALTSSWTRLCVQHFLCTGYTGRSGVIYLPRGLCSTTAATA